MSNPTVQEILGYLQRGRAAKQFVITDEAWYASTAMQHRDRNVIHEVRAGVDALTEDGKDDGTFGEWIITWSALGGSVASKLAIFDDGWSAFRASGFADVMAQFETADVVDRDAFVAALTAAGWRDATKRTDPYRVGTPDRGDST